jgi:hypothetical protein
MTKSDLTEDLRYGMKFSRRKLVALLSAGGALVLPIFGGTAIEVSSIPSLLGGKATANDDVCH